VAKVIRRLQDDYALYGFSVDVFTMCQWKSKLVHCVNCWIALTCNVANIEDLKFKKMLMGGGRGI